MGFTVNVLKTYTPADLPPSTEIYRAACRDCAWSSIWVKFTSSIEDIAQSHVRVFGHTVDIEEREP